MLAKIFLFFERGLTLIDNSSLRKSSKSISSISSKLLINSEHFCMHDSSFDNETPELI